MHFRVLIILILFYSKIAVEAEAGSRYDDAQLQKDVPQLQNDVAPYQNDDAQVHAEAAGSRNNAAQHEIDVSRVKAEARGSRNDVAQLQNIVAQVEEAEVTGSQNDADQLQNGIAQELASGEKEEKRGVVMKADESKGTMVAKRTLFWLMAIIVLMVSFLERPLTYEQHMNVLEENLFEIREEIQTLYLEISNDGQDSTQMKDQLNRMGRLYSKGYAVAAELDVSLNLEREQTVAEFNLAFNEDLQPLNEQLHAQIAAWREILVKPGDFMRLFYAWAWYLQRRREGENDKLKLNLHYEIDNAEKHKIEDTIASEKCRGMRFTTSWLSPPLPPLRDEAYYHN